MSDYELQEPIFIVTNDGKLIVTLPDDNFSFFGFHAKVNEKMEAQETGTIHEDTNKKPENGWKEWSVCITNTTLNEGDVVNYWIHVTRYGMEYHKTGSWVVPIVPKFAEITVAEDIKDDNEYDCVVPLVEAIPVVPEICKMMSFEAVAQRYSENYMNIEAE